MIEYPDWKNMKNEYAFVTQPTPEEEQELMSKGFTYFSGRKIEDPNNKDYGKYREMWIR